MLASEASVGMRSEWSGVIALAEAVVLRVDEDSPHLTRLTLALESVTIYEVQPKLVRISHASYYHRYAVFF